MKIIFGQGNPGNKYKNNRHNVGFMTMDKLAEEHSLSWKLEKDFKAEIAEFTSGDEKILLVKPQTFYNETGASARKILDYYHLKVKNDILIIHDELMLPLGTIRVRNSGRDAGNNGIKSLNSHLGQEFHRVRVGIENELRPAMDADEFVLGNFSSEELKHLKDEIIPHIIEYVESFISGKPEIISKTISRQ